MSTPANTAAAGVTKRPRAMSFHVGLPRVPEEIFDLRNEDPDEFGRRLRSFLNEKVNRCHPVSEVGWWCCYPSAMKYLLTYLAEPPSGNTNAWTHFRKQVADQLSCCRQCAVAYHSAFAAWEVSEETADWPRSVLRKRVVSLVEWSARRLIPLLEKGIQLSSSFGAEGGHAERTQCREAFLETLVSLRLCMHQELCNTLGKVFKRRNPALDAEEVYPFIKTLRFVPPGLVALCFHSSTAVRSWAQRCYHKCRNQLQLSSNVFDLLLQKATRLIQDPPGSVCLSADNSPSELCGWASDSICRWDGFKTILQAMKKPQLEAYVRKQRRALLPKMFAPALVDDAGSVVLLGCECLSYIIGTLPFEALFDGKSVSPEDVLSLVFRAFENRHRVPQERRALLKLLGPLIESAKQRDRRGYMTRLYRRCFEHLEGAQESFPEMPMYKAGLEHQAEFASRRECRRDLLNAAAGLLNQFFAHTLPFLPFHEPQPIAAFVVKAIKEEPDGDVTWELLRTILFNDVFNLIRCMYDGRDVTMIGETFLSLQPDGWHVRTEEEDILKRIIREAAEDDFVFTWIKPLWEAIRNGSHVKDSGPDVEKVRAHEVTIMLDLHRILGVLDPERCAASVHEERLGKIRRFPEPGKDAESVRDAIKDFIKLAQDAIAERLRKACDNVEEGPFYKQIPFHATHLLSSSRREIARLAFNSLHKQYNIHTASYATASSRSKLLLHLMGQDKSTSSMVSSGCLSSMHIISALGSNVSARTYSSFFLWYRRLNCEDSNVLERSNTAKWALGVVLTFVESWKDFEQTTEPHIFREACCSFFSNLREVWPSFVETSSGLRTSHRSAQADVDAWLHKVITGLLTMHPMKDETTRAAWVHTITHENFRTSLQGVEEHEQTVSKIIRRHEERRGPLGVDQCRKLAQALNLRGVEHLLAQWSKEERNQRGSMRGAASKQYQNTTIDEFFPALQSKGAAETRQLSKSLSELPNHAQGKPGAATFAGALQKRQMTRMAPRPGNASSTLIELRRDHKQARADLRRAPKKSLAAASQAPAKTQFELLREQQKAERERKKGQTGHVMQRMEVSPEKSLLPTDRSRGRGDLTGIEHMSEPSEDSWEAKDLLMFPHHRRSLESRLLDRIYRDVIMTNDPLELASTGHRREPPDSFENVESYVSYWEPFLIAEFRASIQNKVKEEREFAVKNSRAGKYIGCRAEFEVDGPLEDVGYLQTISLQSCDNRGNGSSSSGSAGDFQYDAMTAQASDLVLLDIPPPKFSGSDTTDTKSIEAIGIVSQVDRKRGVVCLKLRVVFDYGPAPGKGRRLKASKLTSLTTFQRQLDALWALPKAPDGVLWSLLEPREGLRLKREMEERDEPAIDLDSRRPLQIVSRMQEDKVLNPSQASAISDVVRSCSVLFRASGELYHTPQYAKPDHGSISLIQGPPGTGKTSTIVALLSAILSCLEKKPYRRRAKVILEGAPYVMSIPAVRVLICAPSNAAVDELMTRVIREGIITASGYRAAPRIVRVGRGTTLEELRRFEIRALAGCGSGDSDSRDVRSSDEKIKTSRQELDKLNVQIGEADKQRRECSTSEQSTTQSQASEGQAINKADRFHELTRLLTALHEKKKMLIAEISREKEFERQNETARKRENMKKMSTILNQASVVFATLNSAGHEVMKTLGAKFDIIVVDEAAQSCEPEALIPITYGQHVGSSKTRFVHTVLVGDPKQLPATVLSGSRQVQRAMGRSLFERIGNGVPDTIHMLDVQYRMHPRISSFPNEKFYAKRLLNGANVKNKVMHRAYHRDRQRRFGPLTFFDTSASSAKEVRSAGGSLSNREEGKIVVSALLSLVTRYRLNTLVDQIVVLSPYRQQVALLKRQISERKELTGANIEVSTIDGIQGREKSVVLLSTVRSGHAENIGFVNDDRRMNVAITRAKHSLMVFGHAQMLSTHSQSWASFVSHCRQRSRLVRVPRKLLDLFPEARKGQFVSHAPELPPTDKLSDIEDDSDTNLPIPSDAGNSLGEKLHPRAPQVASKHNVPQVSKPRQEVPVQTLTSTERVDGNENHIVCPSLSHAIEKNLRSGNFLPENLRGRQQREGLSVLNDSKDRKTGMAAANTCRTGEDSRQRKPLQKRTSPLREREEADKRMSTKKIGECDAHPGRSFAHNETAQVKKLNGPDGGAGGSTSGKDCGRGRGPQESGGDPSVCLHGRAAKDPLLTRRVPGVSPPGARPSGRDPRSQNMSTSPQGRLSGSAGDRKWSQKRQLSQMSRDTSDTGSHERLKATSAATRHDKFRERFPRGRPKSTDHKMRSVTTGPTQSGPLRKKARPNPMQSENRRSFAQRSWRPTSERQANAERYRGSFVSARNRRDGPKSISRRNAAAERLISKHRNVQSQNLPVAATRGPLSEANFSAGVSRGSGMSRSTEAPSGSREASHVGLLPRSAMLHRPGTGRHSERDPQAARSSAPLFSLAETQKKMRGTLNAARRAQGH